MDEYPKFSRGAMDPEYNVTMSNSVWRNQYLGASANATKALQLLDISKLGMSGIQNVEIGTLEPIHWEAIPKEHFEQMKQLAKLQLGKQAMISVHAPVNHIDVGGFDNNQWSEDHRQFAQEFMKDVIDKATLVQVDKTVPVPVTIHGSSQVAMSWKWDDKRKELVKDAEYLVDPAEGKVVPIKEDKKYFPGGTTVLYKVDLSDEEKAHAQSGTPMIINGENVIVKDRFTETNEMIWKSEKDRLSMYSTEMIKAEREIANARNDVERLEWTKRSAIMKQNFNSELISIFDKIKRADPEKAKSIEDKSGGDPNEVWNEMQKYGSRNGYGEEVVPATLVRLDDWARKNAAKTFAELAYYSYDKYEKDGRKAPFVSVENWSPERALGRGTSMKACIDEARKLLTKKLMEKKKLSESNARKIADEKIKATWDIAHTNMMRKFGSPEVYDVNGKPTPFWKKEIEAIQKDIGHVHISDNFGFQDAHLSPGMGNTPVKEFLAHLEKEGKMGKVRAILESGGTIGNLGIPPSHTEALQYLNAPLYPGISSPSPECGETRTNYFFGGAGEGSGYTSGYGKFLPEGHFNEYGTGFSQLPYSFGGTRPGTEGQQSKFSGAPMS